MSSAKIVVLSLKEIIRVALFAICGILVLILIIYMFMPKDSVATMNDEIKSTTEEGGADTARIPYKNGEYVSQIPLSKGESYVKVIVEDENIVNVSITDNDVTSKSFYPLLDTVCNQINDEVCLTNSLDIQTDYSNEFTNLVLRSAIDDALVMATK